MNFEGLVEVITSKDVSTKYGSKPVYSMKLRTSDGEVWINYGFNKPSAEKGQYISQEVEKSAYGWDVPKGSKPSVKSTPSSSAGGTTMKAATTYAPRVEFPVPDTDRGMSICRQNALTNAVVYFGNVNKKATVEDVLSTAAEFARWTTGHLEVEMAKAITSGGVFPGLGEDTE